MSTSVKDFNFLAQFISEIWMGSQNLMLELLPLATPHTLKLLCVLPVLGKIKQSAKFQHQHHSSALSIVQLCEYVFALDFALYVPQNWGF